MTKVIQEVNKVLNNQYVEVRLFNAADGLIISRGHYETTEQGTVKYVADTDGPTEALLAEERAELV